MSHDDEEDEELDPVAQAAEEREMVEGYLDEYGDRRKLIAEIFVKRGEGWSSVEIDALVPLTFQMELRDATLAAMETNEELVEGIQALLAAATQVAQASAAPAPRHSRPRPPGASGAGPGGFSLVDPR